MTREGVKPPQLGRRPSSELGERANDLRQKQFASRLPSIECSTAPQSESAETCQKVGQASTHDLPIQEEICERGESHARHHTYRR